MATEATLESVRQNPDPVTANTEAAPVDTTPLCGGRFVPFARLGSGSQAETLEGVDRQNGQLVAIKRFDVHGATSWKDVELAEREARVLSTLSHPGLAKYVHHFEENGSLYLVMERVQGENLARELASGKRFALEELWQLLETLSGVFAYLHGHSPPIVHRDVKPSNLVKRAGGGYALIDFGSVRDGLRPEGGSTVVGTFGYMAPEQFQGRAIPASDLYGVGATLLTLLTGTTPEKLPHRGLEIDVRAALPRTLPEPWLDLLERLLAADPDRRAASLEPLLAPVRLGFAQASAHYPHASHSGSQPGYGRVDESNESPTLTQPRESEWVFAAGTSIPFFLIVILQIVRIVVYVALQIALPILLNILSVFFGRALRQAATDVSRMGTTTDLQLKRLLDQAARAEPVVVSHQRRQKASRMRNSGSPSGRTAGKRRMRVGNFDVELPDDIDSEQARRNQRSSR